MRHAHQICNWPKRQDLNPRAQSDPVSRRASPPIVIGLSVQTFLIGVTKTPSPWFRFIIIAVRRLSSAVCEAER
jgi:hypothetical protein